MFPCSICSIVSPSPRDNLKNLNWCKALHCEIQKRDMELTVAKKRPKISTKSTYWAHMNSSQPGIWITLQLSGNSGIGDYSQNGVYLELFLFSCLTWAVQCRFRARPLWRFSCVHWGPGHFAASASSALAWAASSYNAVIQHPVLWNSSEILGTFHKIFRNYNPTDWLCALYQGKKLEKQCSSSLQNITSKCQSMIDNMAKTTFAVAFASASAWAASSCNCHSPTLFTFELSSRFGQFPQDLKEVQSRTLKMPLPGQRI